MNMDKKEIIYNFTEGQKREAWEELKSIAKGMGEPVYAKYGEDVISKCFQVGNDEMWSHENDGIDYFYQYGMDENGHIYQLMFDLDDIAEQYNEENEGEEWDRSLDTIDYDHPTYIEKCNDDEELPRFLELAVVNYGCLGELIENVYRLNNKYSLYCLTADNKSFYLTESGEEVLCVDNRLPVKEQFFYMNQALKNDFDSESEKAYVFATCFDNRDRMEDLWQEYKDDEGFFLQISDEFESGFEQYCEEIGTDLEL